MHPGRSAYNHLLFLAQTQGLPRRRVDEVLDLVGLKEVARKRTGGFSLGHEPAGRHRRGHAGRPQVCCWTSRSTGSTPRASCGSGT